MGISIIREDGYLVRLLTEAKTEGLVHKVPELVAHPLFSLQESAPPENIGFILDEAEVRRQFPVHFSRHPVWITDPLIFLGEIPGKFSVEQTDPGKRKILLPGGRTGPDQLLDDSALVFQSRAGLVIITGCSHTGICTITEYAREVCKERRIVSIIGGLHLLSQSLSLITQTGEYLQSLQLQALYDCHCTSLSSKNALSGYCPVRKVGLGMKVEW